MLGYRPIAWLFLASSAIACCFPRWLWKRQGKAVGHLSLPQVQTCACQLVPAAWESHSCPMPWSQPQGFFFTEVGETCSPLSSSTWLDSLFWAWRPLSPSHQGQGAHPPCNRSRRSCNSRHSLWGAWGLTSGTPDLVHQDYSGTWWPADMPVCSWASVGREHHFSQVLGGVQSMRERARACLQEKAK